MGIVVSEPQLQLFRATMTSQATVIKDPSWANNAKQLLTTLSDSAQRAVRLAESMKKYSDQSYQNALNEFYGKYVWRHPVETDLDSMMSTVNEAIYNYMQGPSEFTITGTLKNYDATPFLKQITVPVLYTVGEFDEANPVLIQHFASLTPGTKAIVLKGAAHMTPWDARDENVLVVRQFLHSVDSVRIAARD